MVASPGRSDKIDAIWDYGFYWSYCTNAGFTRRSSLLKVLLCSH